MNTAEVIDLKCSAANVLTWDVSSTSYLKGFEIVVEVDGVVVDRVEVAASVRAYGLVLTQAATVVVRAIVLQGGKSITVNPLPVEPPPPVSGISYGLVLNDDVRSAVSLDAIKAVGAKLVRSQTATVAEAKQFISEGIAVLPIIGSVAEASQWLGSGVKLVEFKNETNYNAAVNNKAGGEAYAREAREAAEILASGGIGLLVQASDAGVPGSGWIDGLFAAVPNLDSIVAGYTIHPYYGGAHAGDPDTWGIPMMERMVAGLESFKAVKPVAITEWGETSANGKELTGKPSNLTYAEAAEIVTQEIPPLLSAAKGRVSVFTVYCAHDLHTWASEPNWENFFGVVGFSGEAKEPYTSAVRTLLA